jgi:serine/threonine protein kinase
MDYANGVDLQFLLKVRGTLTQDEVACILKQVVHGCADMWKANVIHRDIKDANILLDFPDNPELEQMDKKQKARFLLKFNFT